MRLTLRTLLAYLDDVLEPADAEELGRKIRESDFAAGLVERIKGVTKKLRMDAPKVDGKGLGNDANTVAEYLDSALPQDRVGDFERICLESDKHLCEVAACHRVLTLVLGKAADVPMELRERVYALGHPDAEDSSVTSKAGGRDAKIVAPPPLPTNGRPGETAAPLEVPEYLRAGRERSQWSLVSGIALLLLLGVVVASLLAPSKFGRSSLAFLSGGSSGSPEAAENEPAPEPARPTPADPSTNEPADTPVPSVPAPAPGDAAPPPLVAPPPVTEPVPPGPPVATAPPPAVPGRPAPPPDEPVPAAPPANSNTGAPPAPASPAPREPQQVGRYTSDGQLLATFNPADGAWYPKRSGDVLMSGERLIVLPSYRPQILLPSAVQLTFAGEGAVTMQPPSATGVPHVSVNYGRLLAMTAGKAGAEVQLDLAEVRGVLTLVDADSSAAIAVSRWVPPGDDPAEAPGMPVIEIYNNSGKVTWQPTNGAQTDKVELAAHYLYLYMGDDAPQALGPFSAPEWIDAKSGPPTDREHAAALERLIKPDRPLGVSLQELATSRRVENRALAARCLAALGDFEPIIRELGDARQYSYWPIEFLALRRETARSTENAAKVRERLNLVRPAEAKDLYRLLWGYSQDQLDRGANSQLIRFLEHEQMDVRVLAYMNLVTITEVWGYYHPERPPSQSKAAIQNWKDRREKGSIVYLTPPSPFDVNKSLPPPPNEGRPAVPGVK